MGFAAALSCVLLSMSMHLCHKDIVLHGLRLWGMGQGSAYRYTGTAVVLLYRAVHDVAVHAWLQPCARGTQVPVSSQDPGSPSAWCWCSPTPQTQPEPPPLVASAAPRLDRLPPQPPPSGCCRPGRHLLAHGTHGNAAKHMGHLDRQHVGQPRVLAAGGLEHLLVGRGPAVDRCCCGGRGPACCARCRGGRRKLLAAILFGWHRKCQGHGLLAELLHDSVVGGVGGRNVCGIGRGL